MKQIWNYLDCGVFILSVLPVKNLPQSAIDRHNSDKLNHQPLPEFSLEEYNSAFSQITGITTFDDFLDSQVWHDLIVDKAWECWQDQSATGYLLEGQNIYLKISPLPDQNRVLGCCYPLNLFRRHDKKLGTNSQNFSELVRDFSDATLVVDRSGYVVYVNHAAESLFNRPAEELEGELFGMPVVVGEKTDVDIIRKGGETASAEMRIKETVGVDKMVYVIASLHDITERKKVEQYLRLQERAMAASANGIVITDATDPINPIIYVNPAFEKITGYSAKEVIGKNCRLLQGRDTNQTELNTLRASIKEGKECHVILSNCRKDGSQFWNSLYVSPVLDNQGVITNFVGIQTDITSQIISEQKLKQSEERLSKVLSFMRQGVTFSDRSGHFLIFNSEMERLTGYSMQEANQYPEFLTRLYPEPQDYQKALDRLQELESKQAITNEVQMFHKNGTRRDVEISSLLMDYNGQSMYLSVYYDITDRKRNEQQILRQNQLLRLLNSITLKIQTQVDIDQILTVAVEETRQLLDTCRVGIYKFDQQWNGCFIVESARSPEIAMLHQTVNDSCFREYHLDKYLNGHISSIDDVQNSPQVAECHRRLLAKFQIKANIVTPIIYGGKLWGLLIAHQCDAPRNWQELEVDLIKQISNHVAIAIQQTELTKNLEQQVADRTRELESALAKEKELGELKTRFISMTSHEFRTPLATIQAASDLLLNYSDKMPAPKRNDRLLKIQREVKKMTFLLEEVLTMGRANAGKLSIRIEAMDVHQFAKDCLEQAQNAATPEHQLVLVDEWSGEREFYADRQLLQQAVINLLVNGIKYSPRGGHICLCIQGNANHLNLRIRDNGIGIPAEELPHIFESFYRAQNVGNISGTGLGLAIAHAVVELHHGTITVDSMESQGTTFSITIPDQRNQP